MAGKRREEPQNLSSLKRPALQKLCKQYGLKANGKNTEMVRLLEEYRATHSLEAHSEENSSCGQLEPVSQSQQEERGYSSVGGGEMGEVGRCEEGRGESEGLVRQEEVTESERGERKGRGKTGGKKRIGRGRRKGKTLAVPSVSAVDETSCDDQHSPVIPQTVSMDSCNGPEKENLASYSDPCDIHVTKESRRALEDDDFKTDGLPESSNGVTGHRKRRRDTHSVSPSPDSSGGGGEPLPNSEQSCETAAETEDRGENIATETTSEDVAMETTSEDVAVETTPEDVAMETTSERRRTYSVSPRPTSTSADENAPPLSPLSREAVTTPTSGSRKRRRTHSISPASSLLLSGTISMDTGTVSTATEEATAETKDVSSSAEIIVSDGGSATNEMLALLDKRVADRKADPGYVSPPSLPTQSGVTGSRIPVSKTVAKINMAHEKQFSKMPSILEFSEQRKKRVLTMQKSTPVPPAKKQKVNPKTPVTASVSSNKKSTVTKPRIAPSSHKKPSGGPTIVRPVVPKSASATTSKPKTTTAAHFEPNLCANINFSKTTSSPVTKTTNPIPDSGSRPFTFNSQSDSPRMIQPRKGTSQLKTHRGRLPEFKHSIY